MDPYSKLKQVRDSLDKTGKTIESLQNDMLEILKENTELKVENKLLHEQLNKMTKQGEPVVKTQSGLESLRQIYNSGYHICNTYYGHHRDPNTGCMLCMDILDNFGEKKKRKNNAKAK